MSRKATRFALADKYGWVCWYCGVDLSQIEFPRIKGIKGDYVTAFDRNLYWNRPQIDHIVAKSKGGSSDLDNLALTCGFCNNAKGDCDLSLYLEWLDRIRFGITSTPIMRIVDGTELHSHQNRCHGLDSSANTL